MKSIPTFPFFIFLSTSLCSASGPSAPTGLLCELLRDPERAVITDPNPEFGWVVNDSRRGAVQAGYQVIVASSAELLKDDRGDFWDSGKVSSSQSINVEYGGSPLKSRTTYWWKVRSWDADGVASPYSAARKFNTGDLESQSGKWPGESKWFKLREGDWVLENRQRSDFVEQAPTELVEVGKGQYFADFGKAVFGTLQLCLTSQNATSTVTVYLGERRTNGDRVHKQPGRSNIGFKKVELSLEKGTHLYTLELPRHELRYPNSQRLPDHILEVAPFRFVEVVDSPSRIRKKDIRRLALFYPFDDGQSSFLSSHTRLNQVWELCKYTLKATPFLSLYLDGNRERMPYEADAYIQQLGHYAVDREFSVARHTLDFLIHGAAWPTEWQMHTVFMAWADYLQTGNDELIRRNYEDLKAKTLMALAREDGLISTRTGLVTPEFLETIHYEGEQFTDIVDWPAGTPQGQTQASNRGPTPAGERDNYDFGDINTVVNALHYRSLVQMAEMAEAIGRGQDASKFRTRARQVRESFNKKLFDSRRGVYIDGEGSSHASLHANMFPLACGLVPKESVPSVVEHIKSRGMACGVYGAQYLLDGLFDVGESEAALQLMTSEDKRSWMNMIRVGSTMTTEAWDEYFKPNLTWNHAWGSAPANIIARKLMGIEPLRPGFESIRIRPQPGSLTKIELRVPSIRGGIEVTWKREGSKYLLDVTIPANTEAEVWLPARVPGSLMENGVPVTAVGGVRVIGQQKEAVICRIGGGSYHFTGGW